MNGNINQTNAEATKCKKTHHKTPKKPSGSELEPNLTSADLSQAASSLLKAKNVQKSDSFEKKKGKGKIFKLNEQLGEENLYTEFKNFTCPEIIEKQYLLLTKLICGFLNTQGGKIFIGVDNAACIKGRTFTRDGKKKFKQTLLKMVAGFAPAPHKKAVKIKFNRIADDKTGEPIEDRFVVIIKVKKGPIDVLYADQDGKSYYRLDGQTRKYSPQEYSDELILRKTKQQSLQEYAEKINKSPGSQGASLSGTDSAESYYSNSEGQEYYPCDPMEEAALYGPYNELEELAVQAYYQAVENQIALEEGLQSPEESWYQDPSAGIEGWIPNASMGGYMGFPQGFGYYDGFAGEMPQIQSQFYPQQMMSQQAQGVVFPQQTQYVYYQYTNPPVGMPQYQDPNGNNSIPSGNQIQGNQNASA